MKTAQSVAQKYVDRASAATEDYFKGARDTTKDQSALAISAIPRMKTGWNKAVDSGRVAKKLQASGKAGWLAGVEKKGKDRYGPGVLVSMAKYATESARFDTARNAAANMPTGDKGSATNLAKVAAVVNALRLAKTG